MALHSFPSKGLSMCKCAQHGLSECFLGTPNFCHSLFLTDDSGALDVVSLPLPVNHRLMKRSLYRYPLGWGSLEVWVSPQEEDY